MLVNGESATPKRYVKNHLKDDTLDVPFSNVTLIRQTEYLVEKFEQVGCDDAKNCYFFFKKCFMNLSEATIWNIFENATHNSTIRSPIKYFIAACSNQMALK